MKKEHTDDTQNKGNPLPKLQKQILEEAANLLIEEMTNPKGDFIGICGAIRLSKKPTDERYQTYNSDVFAAFCPDEEIKSGTTVHWFGTTRYNQQSYEEQQNTRLLAIAFMLTMPEDMIPIQPKDYGTE